MRNAILEKVAQCERRRARKSRGDIVKMSQQLELLDDNTA